MADLVEVDLTGLRLRGCRDASTELDLHLRVYRGRKDCGAVIHGALTWGGYLTQARIRMECLEHRARIILAACAAGGVNHLTRS